jgi:hypothetical protein
MEMCRMGMQLEAPPKAVVAGRKEKAPPRATGPLV